MIADVLEPIGTLFQHTSLGVMVIDQDCRIVLANAALEAMFGYEPDELNGQPFYVLVPPDNQAAHAARLADPAMTPHGQPLGRGMDVAGRRKDGRLFPVEVNLSYFPHEGQIIPVAMVTDASERKRIEQERDHLLREAEAVARSKEQALSLLDTVLQSAPIGLAFLDRDLRYQLINPRLAEINGVAAEAQIGHTIAEILPALAGSLQPPLRLVLETGEPILNLELAQPAAGEPGGQRTLLCNYYPIFTGGAVQGIGCVIEEVTERKRAEAALRANEARFRLLAENAQDLIYRYRFAPTRGFEYVSPAAAALTGYSPEEHYADPDLGFKIVHPDDRAILETQTRPTNAGDESIELRWIRKDGAIVWTEQRNVQIFDNSGALVALEGIARDITKRKQAEIALRESEERFRATFEQAPLGIAHIAPSGQILRANQRLCDIVGYTHDELIANSLSQLVLSDIAADGERRARQLLTNELPSYTIEQKYDFRNGASIWLNVTMSLVRGNAGEPKYFIALIEDITERRQADETRARLAAIVESSDDAIVGKTLDGTILSWNASAERIFGYRAEEAIGRDIALLLPGDRLDEEASVLARIRAGERIAHFESVRVRKDGLPIEVALTISPIRNGSGKIIGISKIARDITEQKRAEEALRRQTIYTRLLQTVAVAANQARTPAQALQIAIDQICQHIGWPIGHVYLPFEGELHVLRSANIWHFDEPDRFKLLRTLTQTIGLSGDDDLPTRVVLSGLPEWATDLQSESMGRRNQMMGEIGVRASFAFPVLVGAEVAAVLEFFSAEPQEPDEPLQIVMAHIGAQLGQVFERERTAAALRASEERYRLIADNTVDMIALLGDSGNIAYASPSFHTVLGYDPSALYGDRIEKMIDPDWLVQAAQLWAETRAHSVAQATLRLRHADGNWRWIDVRAALAAESNERYIVAIGHDATERVRAERALRSTEAQYRTLVEQVPAIVYTAAIDAASSTRYVSPQIESILGFSAEEWLAQPDLWLRQVHPDDRARILRDVALTQASDAPTRSEYRSYTRDGKLVWLQDTSHIVRDEVGNPLFMQGVAVDITERKQAEEALRHSERLYRTLMRNFPNGAVMLFDHDLRYTIADGAGASEVGGRSPKDIEGRPLREAHTEELAALLEQRYRAALAGMPSILEETFDDRTFVFYILPVRDERGQIIAGMVMTQDITERKRIENALVEERALLARRVEERTADLSAANAELARAARLKDEFLANMSHELRTPLNAVLGLSEALLEEAYGALADEQARALRTIAESGRHLLDLINDILDLAKIGAGKLELDIAPVAVPQICQASLRLIKQVALKKHISVESSIDPAAATLQADARRLKQTLANLLSNAVKFTPDGGSIGLEVRADAEHRRIDLVVWDTGIGIAEEHFERLFKPFVQLDSRLARQFEGTGLGLALVYRMVEMHGGSIAVASSVGAGSRFTISLPWRPDAELPASAAEREQRAYSQAGVSAQAETAPRTILLAEDNETNIALVSDYLAARGYHVVVTRNGAEALARAREVQPDLILMDIQMPGMDGLEATRRIRADDVLSAIPIIALTALAMPGDRERCLAAGANAYLSKPVSLRGLAQTIDSTLLR